MGEAKRKEELLKQAKEELERWGARPIVLEMGMTEAIAMCGAMQLALRHPAFVARPSAGAVREIVFAIKDQVPPDYGAIRKLLELGFHQRFDT